MQRDQMQKKRTIEIHSPLVPMFSNGSYGRRVGKFRAEHALAKRVQKVSQRAALVSKQKIWDSNDASIDVAQSAVDVWEKGYTGFRSLLIQATKSAIDVYDAAKSGAHKIEHSLLVPVRDIVLLPAFAGAERVTAATIHFLQNDQIASMSLNLVRQTPLVGENILAPALVHTFYFIKSVWNVVQYPIPSRDTVRFVVDTTLTSTKWAIRTACRETYFYFQLVDATVTRTLMHTQWRVLGSGPYVSLDDRHKKEVIDHLCERYFTLADIISRYELATHIKRQNRALYNDLVMSGLLKFRGGDITRDDVWLDMNPIYRNTYPTPLFIPQNISSGQELMEDERTYHPNIGPLWFYKPSQNGNKLTKDTPWIPFSKSDRNTLEHRFLQLFRCVLCDGLFDDDAQERCNHELNQMEPSELSMNDMSQDYSYPTLSSWYDPDIKNDVFVENHRYAVSFLSKCSVCKRRLNNSVYESSYCDACVQSGQSLGHDLLHPITLLMRPTLWRFHGEGNDVRRAVWLMDTQRYGLQPYSDESSSILEDAYLYLTWLLHSKTLAGSSIDAVLLTVSVTGPNDGEEQLVQFRSLKQITAIPKSLGSGFSLFKRRVYRGIHFELNEHLRLPTIDDSNCDTDIAAPAQLHADPMSFRSATHLVLVIHGIGEMLRTVDLFGITLPAITSTLIDCCDSLRKQHAEIMSDYEWIDIGSTCVSNHVFGRVEYLPVEWHDAFAIQSRRSPTAEEQLNDSLIDLSKTTMHDISLKTIQGLRNFANNTMMDILFYMSPLHHDIMLDIVIKEANFVVTKYRHLTGFTGKISILAHSLGSIITWDLLMKHNKPIQQFIRIDDIDTPLTCSSKRHSHRLEQLNTSVVSPALDFDVENVFMIGSPLAVFLMMRNFSITEDFYLPGCQSLFNIFHPYDPVAYRIEPLVDKQNAFHDPKIIPHWKGGYRVQYQTRFLWRQLLDELMKTQKYVVNNIEKRLETVGLLGTHNGTSEEDDDDSSSVLSGSSSNSVNCGNLSRGMRIDYMLQEKEIENANEYLFALAAHSSYWGEKDLSLFLARHIIRSSLYDLKTESLSI